MEKIISPSYINGFLKSLRAFFKYAHDEGAIQTNPAAKINRQHEGKVLIETFTDEEVHALSVRQAEALPQASFRLRLTTDALAFG